ncbi:MAG: hypothetical protein IJL24_08600 [Treponema sp.]|nr:hypothetical protein [Treponema sp.]
MNDFVKIEVAREIMNFMIGRHGQKGYDKSNKMLMQLLEDEKAMKKNDMAAVEKIIRVYGPVARGEGKEL